MLHRVRYAVSVLLAGVVLVVLAKDVSAQEKFLRWHRWDANIWIQEDGSFQVEETFEIEFVSGEFTFGFRDIPINWFEAIRDVRVREGAVEYDESHSEAAHTFYWNSDGDKYSINWFYPPTSGETRVFTLEYVVEGGLFVDAKLGDRLFWKAVGPDHAFPIDSSSVVIYLPLGATVATSTSDPAALGPNGDYEISPDGTFVSYTASNIPSNVAFEVGVYFPHGFVTSGPPQWQAEYEREQSWNESGRPIFNLVLGALGIFMLVAGPLGVYVLWLMAGRDPSVGPIPTYLSEPPDSSPPGVVGTLVDERADLQDIIATLIDLARRGAIAMEERDKKVFGVSTGRNFTFRKTNDVDGLRKYERTLVKKVFGSKDKVDLDDLRERFYAYVPQLQKELYEEAVAAGYFSSSPKAVRSRYLGLGIGLLVLSVGAGFCVASALSQVVDAVLCPFVGLGVTAIVLIGISNVMPTKTRKGAEGAAQWRAFKAYLKNIDDYADLSSVTDQFETYLPYAIAFGLERQWINDFARVPSTPVPGWYVPVGRSYGTGHSVSGMGKRGHGAAGGGTRDLRGEAARPAPSLDGMADGMFSGLSSMSSGLFSMLNSTSSAFTSVPHSSGSSGGSFSGGGFSGGFSSGGGGGGGGAGFG